MKGITFLLEVGKRVRFFMQTPNGNVLVLVVFMLCVTLIILRIVPHYFGQ